MDTTGPLRLEKGLIFHGLKSPGGALDNQFCHIRAEIDAAVLINP